MGIPDGKTRSFKSNPARKGSKMSKTRIAALALIAVAMLMIGPAMAQAQPGHPGHPGWHGPGSPSWPGGHGGAHGGGHWQQGPICVPSGSGWHGGPGGQGPGWHGPGGHGPGWHGPGGHGPGWHGPGGHGPGWHHGPGGNPAHQISHGVGQIIHGAQQGGPNGGANIAGGILNIVGGAIGR